MGIDLHSSAAVVALLALAAGAARLAGLGQARQVPTAGARAAVQLTAVGAVVAFVFRTPALAPLYLAVMVAVASLTSGQRLRRAAGHPALTTGIAAAAISAGVACTATVVLAAGALPVGARSAVPFIAQLVGGSMTATTLAGQRFGDDVDVGWAEVEGWLPIGATPTQAVLGTGRRAAARALVPAIDQTRNLGLVVLPGAYVGLLLGSASPLEAGRVQLLVLVGLLTAETVAAVAVNRLLGPGLALWRPAFAP